MAQMRSCTALYCEARIPVGKIMCDAHWKLVGPECRAELIKTYVPGSYTQLTKDAKTKFTMGWLNAVKAAQAEVDKRVG